MYRNQKEIQTDRKPSPFQGVGEITVRSLLEGPEAMYQKGRVFAHTTVYPGSSIGYHIHNNESETYYILSGSGKYNDNGTITEFEQGDVLFCGDGEGHGIEALDEPIEMIALILYHNE
ncbi:MAG: cupin domain-containing protein [Lachnospiraceae bacterium]